ncbi:hypothetical protein [Limosilactobacillus fermentum]
MGLFKHRYTKSNDTMNNGAMLITLADPKSGPAEQFRDDPDQHYFMSVDRPLKTVAFTSSGIGREVHGNGQRGNCLGPRRQAGPLIVDFTRHLGPTKRG